MRKKKILIISATMFSCSMMLCSCALPEKLTNAFSTTKEISDENIPLTEAPVTKVDNENYSEAETRIIELLNKESIEGLSTEEYLELSSLYKSEEYIKLQRDTLEKLYRLTEDASVLSTLSTVAVNLKEEDSSVTDLTDTITSYFLSSEDIQITNALKLMESEAWKTSLMPVLCDGERTYFAKDDSGVYLIIKAGYNEEGVFKTSVYFEKENKKINLVLSGRNASVYVEKENGEFTLTSILLSKGLVRTDSAFVKDNLLDGDYKATISYYDDYNKCASDILSSLDSFSKESYVGQFANGVCKTELPSDNSIASIQKESENENAIVYALSEDKSTCLYVLSEENETENFTFDIYLFGASPSLTVESYEPKELIFDPETPLGALISENNAEQIKVRVLDGTLQVFDGNAWINFGDIASLISNDPYKAYNDKKDTLKNHAQKESNDIETLSANTAKIIEEKKTTTSATTGSSSSTTKKNNNTTTSSTPTKTPATGGSSGSGSASAPSSGGSTPSGSSSTPSGGGSSDSGSGSSSTPSTPSGGGSSDSGSGSASTPSTPSGGGSSDSGSSSTPSTPSGGGNSDSGSSETPSGGGGSDSGSDSGSSSSGDGEDISAPPPPDEWTGDIVIGG